MSVPTGLMLEEGTVTAGGATTITDTKKNWPVNQFATTPHVIRILGAAGVGEMRLISSNTATAITVPAWTVAPAAGSTYAIFALPSGSVVGTDNLAQVNGATVNVGAGNAGTGTQRVSISTDDVNLSTLKTSGGGGYVRQDSTATIAKETGGNLATLAGAVTSNQVAVKVDSTQATAFTPPTAAAIAAAMNTPAGLTFTRVAITQAGAGVTALIADLASNYTRLHALFLHADAAGTLIIEDSAAGGTDLTGAIPLAAYGGISIPFTANPNGCIISTSGKGLAINTTTSKVFGYAIVSQSTVAP